MRAFISNRPGDALHHSCASGRSYGGRCDMPPGPGSQPRQGSRYLSWPGCPSSLQDDCTIYESLEFPLETPKNTYGQNGIGIPG